MTWLILIVLAVLLFETWCLWRLLALARSLPGVEDRLSRLVHSIGLLVDTTETCFQVIAAQLQDGQGSGTLAAPRRGRQRRVVSAARRGRSVAEIAAQEDVAESEIALRLHMAGGRAAAERGEDHAAVRR